MAVRIGIELSPVTCRIIEIVAAPITDDRSRTEVRSFASFPRSELKSAQSTLASLRGRHANVVVWTAHSSYRPVSVPNGSYERMHSDALRGAAPSGLGQIPVVSDITPASPYVDGAPRRVVLLASVPRTEVAEALGPLKEAGIIVDSILSPGAALASLARLREGLGPSGALEAYWAIEETVSTLALVCDGHLLTARTAPWGYLSEAPSRFAAQPRPREEITMRLAEDIAACLASVQADPSQLAQVCVCGGLPELRNMTLPLMEQFDVEVEPLDTLFGIDAAALPGSNGEFQDRAAAFRLAWAAAADHHPILDFARERQRRQRKAVFRQVAVAAGVLVGLGMGWVLQRQWRPATPAPRSLAEAKQPSPAATPLPVRPPALAASKPSGPPDSAPPVTSPVPASPLAAPPPPFAPGTEVILPKPGISTTPSVTSQVARPLPAPERQTASAPPLPAPKPVPPPAAPAPPARRSVEPLAPLDPPRVDTQVLSAPPRATAQAATPRPAAEPAVNASVAAPRRSPVARTESAAPPPQRAARTEPVAPPPTPQRPVRTAPPAASRTSAPQAATPPADQSSQAVPLPFDASLGTILYGPERKLAIVDGRIVQAGDDVRGATVVEITPTAVYLRDAQGRLRRLTAGGTAR